MHAVVIPGGYVQVGIRRHGAAAVPGTGLLGGRGRFRLSGGRIGIGRLRLSGGRISAGKLRRGGGRISAGKLRRGRGRIGIGRLLRGGGRVGQRQRDRHKARLVAADAKQKAGLLLRQDEGDVEGDGRSAGALVGIKDRIPRRDGQKIPHSGHGVRDADAQRAGAGIKERPGAAAVHVPQDARRYAAVRREGNDLHPRRRADIIKAGLRLLCRSGEGERKQHDCAEQQC